MWLFLLTVLRRGDIKHYENAKGLRNLQSSFFVEANIIESGDNTQERKEEVHHEKNAQKLLISKNRNDLKIIHF